MIYNVYLYLIFMTLLPFFFLLLLNVFIVAKQSMAESLPLSRKTRYDQIYLADLFLA